MTSTGARADGGPANTGTVGISGAVVFQVAAATYSVTTYISIPAITGSSVSNTVTFDGGAGNAATRIITGNTGTGTPVIALNGCTYVTLRNLTFTNTSAAYPGGITIVGSSSTSTATGCNVKNCIVNLPASNTSQPATGISLNYAYYPYYYSGSLTYCENIQIDSNVINGAYYGIAMYGEQNATYNNNLKFRNNTLNNIINFGFYLQYIYTAVELSNNTINMLASTSSTYGMYLYYNQNSTTTPTKVNGNKIRNAAYIGIYYIGSFGTTSAPTQFYNNMIAGGYGYTSTT
jgi:hypothetical protein